LHKRLVFPKNPGEVDKISEDEIGQKKYPDERPLRVFPVF
jgi:hypothetical protein